MLKALDVQIDGSELRQETGEYSIGFSPHVRIHGDGNRLTASGEVALNEGRYSQNFDISNLVLHPRTAERIDPFWVGYPLLETMALEVKVVSTGSLYIKSNVADVSMSLGLEITGTLSEPRFDGAIRIEEGGTFNIPAFRTSFTAKPGEVVFDPEKKLPDQTPTLNISGEGVLLDSNDNSHLLTMRIGGTILAPQLRFESTEGWDQASILAALITGQTPEQLRQSLSASGSSSHSTGPSGTENVLKTATGIGVGSVLANPFQKYFGLDVTTVEFGAGSFDVRLCKRAGRFIKACGYGEVGFAGTSRVEGSLQLRVSDRVSAQGKVEYNNQGIDVAQDSLTHGKLELKLQIPLGY
jgi:hypothetical protein